MSRELVADYWMDGLFAPAIALPWVRDPMPLRNGQLPICASFLTKARAADHKGCCVNEPEGSLEPLSIGIACLLRRPCENIADIWVSDRVKDFFLQQNLRRGLGDRTSMRS
jgi:hypothetical protein